ncbi:hypothetical protein SELMODRAFT_420132 [Selaginella moellendorffii]|uniref:40S ribosomal protein S8 n=1 Tax=Selaginella moellendorffii TaxID=88036 RepID=D8SB25_SELML|nr:hypothetical protein SELMODRAFT_420132 [Selaginella moellendorffii]
MTFAVATPMSGNTQTLVTSAIVQVDATPFRAWYNHHYGVDLSRKKKAAFSKKEGEVCEATGEEEKPKSKHTLRKLAASTPRGANAEWKATRVHRFPAWTVWLVPHSTIFYPKRIQHNIHIPIPAIPRVKFLEDGVAHIYDTVNHVFKRVHYLRRRNRAYSTPIFSPYLVQHPDLDAHHDVSGERSNPRKPIAGSHLAARTQAPYVLYHLGHKVSHLTYSEPVVVQQEPEEPMLGWRCVASVSHCQEEDHPQEQTQEILLCCFATCQLRSVLGN